MGVGITADKLKKEIIADLGGGEVSGDEVSVTVELTDVQFKNALEQGKRWFISKKGWIVYRPLPVSQAVTEYKMKDDVYKVLDVIFDVPSDVAAFYSFGFFDIIPIGPQNTAMFSKTMANYSGFAQLLEFNEQRKRVFSAEPDWVYNDQTKTLYIQERRGLNNGLAIIIAKLNDFDIAKLDGRDADLFARWVKAKCKEIVGRIRSKYDALPAAGGQVTLDGKELIEESKLEFEALNTEIFASQGPDVPVVG